jgi:mannose-6-phosphate isomerase
VSTHTGGSDQGLVSLARHPWPLAPNLVRRFYQGGGLVRRFRGLPDTADSWWSEDWLASCVPSAGDVDPLAGLSAVEDAAGRRVLLRDLVAAHPDEVLGRPPRAGSGDASGDPVPAPVAPEILVKLVSSSTRVPLHAHPSGAWANARLGSSVGKTEAWIVLAAEPSGGEPPYVAVGLRPGVGRSDLMRLVRTQEHEGFASLLVRRRVHAGDVYFIPGGTPHFFGPQVMVLNVQEPSDFTVLAEWDGASTEPAARLFHDWEDVLDAFDFGAAHTPATPDDALQTPTVVRAEGGGREVRLFGHDADEYWAVTRLEVSGSMTVDGPAFSIMVVTDGEGTVEFEGGRIPVAGGQCLASPARLPIVVRANGGRDLTLIRCSEPRLQG